LSDLELDEKLSEEFNRQLAEHGLAVIEASMAILDATIIESANRPRLCIEVSQNREKQDESNSGVLTTESKILESADPDARWLKKGNQFFF
jgi:IS5 family transposase